MCGWTERLIFSPGSSQIRKVDLKLANRCWPSISIQSESVVTDSYLDFNKMLLFLWWLWREWQSNLSCNLREYKSNLVKRKKQSKTEFGCISSSNRLQLYSHIQINILCRLLLSHTPLFQHHFNRRVRWEDLYQSCMYMHHLHVSYIHLAKHKDVKQRENVSLAL